MYRMDRKARPQHNPATLYPPMEPYRTHMFDVGDGHRVYVEECGNPAGLPVVVVHGGPGGGCSPSMRRFFDPNAWRIILFDQRGCGRSSPHAEVAANTTWHLIEDMEHIRQKLGIARWVLFGGSWGATLSLLYAQTHPQRVLHLILRGVFLMTRDELEWFYGGGAGRFFPELWKSFSQMVPPDERGDLIAAYHKRLFSGDPMLEMRYARAWAAWENALASVHNSSTATGPASHAHAFSRLENHYFHNGGFLREDGQILSDMPRIAHIPGVIVQGRFDMICPPDAAYRLYQSWSASSLRMIQLAGHAISEPKISAALVEETDRAARRYGSAKRSRGYQSGG